jgi:N-glycosylase/DNA lyase
VQKEREPLTLKKVRIAFAERQTEIRARLAEFKAIWETGTDDKLFEELVYCLFTGGCSARMGMRSVEAVKPILRTGNHDELAAALTGRHRYPRARAGYIVVTREFLEQDCGLRLRKRLAAFTDADKRRDWLVKEKRIKGLGYKEASHYLRNIGFSGYAILDKHILRSMNELGYLDSPKPPSNRTLYLEVEKRLGQLAKTLDIDFDELDLVLWSMKTGEILK